MASQQKGGNRRPRASARAAIWSCLTATVAIAVLTGARVSVAAGAHWEAAGEVRCFGVDGVALSPPSWSSDGSRIAVDDYDKHGVRIVTVETGHVEEVGVPLWNSPAFGLNGLELVVQDAADRDIKRLVFEASGSSSEISLPYAHLFRNPWSPDGKKLVVAPERSDGSRGAAILSLESGTSAEIYYEGGGRLSVGDAVWDRSGREIILSQFDTTKAIDVGLRTVTAALGVGLRDLAVGRDGTVYGISYEVSDRLVSWQRGENEPEAIADGIASFSLEPVGDRIAVERRGLGLSTFSSTHREMRSLTSDPSDRLPAWSPGGERVAFLRRVDGTRRLCTVALKDEQR